MSNKGLGSMSEIRGQRLDFGHTHLKMSWIHHQISHRDGAVGYPPPPFHPEPTPTTSSPSSSGTKISPAVLFIIVILSVLFFISGVLHLLVRFLMKRQPSSSSQPNDRYPEVSASEALERQLQQLFHLHDSGLDQAFIDALPLFMYKEIKGAKEPFDCAVCLCEFTEKDQLRLLPSCSHAFHLNCIDTWLLSNSTCPLCRAALYNPGMSIENPVFDFDRDMREEDGLPNNGNNGFVPTQKTVEIEEVVTKKGVFPVRLGKFRKLDSSTGETDVGETSSSNLDARRCFSMGSYQYVVGDTKLRVAWKNERGGLDPKAVKGIGNSSTPAVDGDMEGKKISIGSRTDSYSVSKIWLWSKKGKFASSSEAQ